VAKTRVRLDSSAVSAVLSSQKVAAAVHDIAERVAGTARASAPVDSGWYRDSIDVEDDTTDRAVSRVVASAPHAHLVEARTGNLARALGAVVG